MGEPGPNSGRSAALVAAGIGASRLAGLVRERVVANYLGVGPAVDAVRAAMRIPNLLQNLLGDGVLSAAFIPVYAGRVDEDPEEAGRVAGAVAAALSLVVGVLAVIGVVAARPITALLTPGFSGERYELTITLTRIVTPGVAFLVLSAWCLGVLNSHRRFFLSYVAPVIWNGAQIAVLVTVGLRGWATDDLAVALAWGTLVGAALQLSVQLRRARALTGHAPWRFVRGDAAVAEVRRRIGPVIAGRGAIQLSAYADLILASLLATGAVGALGFAQVLYLLPISLFGMSVAASELPELSRAATGGGSNDVVTSRLLAGLERVAFFVVPTAIAYVLVGDLVVGTLFGTGEFGDDGTTVVWLALAAFAIGLPAVTASRLVQNTHYALGDTATPARLAALRMGVALAVGAAAMFPLDRVVVDATGSVVDWGAVALGGPLPTSVREAGDTLRLGIVGLAIGASVGGWLELVLLRRRLPSGLGHPPLGGGHLGQILAASGAAIVVGAPVRVVMAGTPDVVALAATGAAAGITYLVATHRLGVPTARALWAGRR